MNGAGERVGILQPVPALGAEEVGPVVLAAERERERDLLTEPMIAVTGSLKT